MGIQERKERERERRRQQIIVAAKRVFSEKGFSRATMEDIASEAELSPGTLYLYFKNKDELYASLSLRILHYMLIRLEHLNADDEIQFEDRITGLRDAMYDVYEFDPMVLINMFHMQSSETLKNLTPELLQEIKNLSQKALSEMAKLFAEGVQKGVFIDEHPIAMADTVWALFSGLVLWETSKSIINQDKDYLRGTLETAFEIFDRGIRRSKQPIQP
jgi:AcrR family transcriptional regulator